MPTETKLDAGQKHILRLVARDADSEGWATVSSVLLPHLRTSMHAEFLICITAAFVAGWLGNNLFHNLRGR